MYSRFNYNPSNYFYNSALNKHLETGTEIYNLHQNEVQKSLSEYISDNGIINGTRLKEDWFSIKPKHVFISHSHKDLNKVQAFAGWLYENFHIEAFIDSCMWGYCDNLLQKIDRKYCFNPASNTYNYILRNYTTSHVHMMLSTALTEMIDQTECCIFFNTPNSINMSEELDNIKKQKETASPWIYHELMMTTVLRNKTPQRMKPILEHQYSERAEMQKKIEIHYDITKVVENMPLLSDDQLQTWINRFNDHLPRNAEEALDVLYSIVYPKNQGAL